MDHLLAVGRGMLNGTAGLDTQRCGRMVGVERPEVDGVEENAEGISALRLGVLRGGFRTGVFSFFDPSLVW